MSNKRWHPRTCGLCGAPYFIGAEYGEYPKVSRCANPECPNSRPAKDFVKEVDREQDRADING